MSLEFEYLHRKRRCEMLFGAVDISHDVITLGTYFSTFFYIRTCLRFALIGGNLSAQKYISTNLPNTSVCFGSGVKKGDIKSDLRPPSKKTERHR